MDEEKQEKHEPEQEKTIYTWKAPLRPFKRRDREFFTTIIAIAFLIGLILFFLEGLLPVLVVITLVFLVYVLSTVPPEDVEHKITNKAIYMAGTKYSWEDLRRFWFTARFGTDLLVVEAFKAPWRLELVLGEGNKEKIGEILEKYLTLEEASPSFLDKSASWLAKRVPLE